jgi:hypothetical protein
MQPAACHECQAKWHKKVLCCKQRHLTERILHNCVLYADPDVSWYQVLQKTAMAQGEPRTVASFLPRVLDRHLLTHQHSSRGSGGQQEALKPTDGDASLLCIQTTSLSSLTSSTTRMMRSLRRSLRRTRGRCSSK